MKTFLAFPTWVLIRLLCPWLSPHHPWHGLRFSLSDWTEGATDLARTLGALMWLQLVLPPFMFLVFLKHWHS